MTAPTTNTKYSYLLTLLLELLLRCCGGGCEQAAVAVPPGSALPGGVAAGLEVRLDRPQPLVHLAADLGDHRLHRLDVPRHLLRLQPRLLPLLGVVAHPALLHRQRAADGQPRVRLRPHEQLGHVRVAAAVVLGLGAAQVVQVVDVVQRVVVLRHVVLKAALALLVQHKAVDAAAEALAVGVLVAQALVVADGGKGVHDLASEDVGEDEGPDDEEHDHKEGAPLQPGAVLDGQRDVLPQLAVVVGVHRTQVAHHACDEVREGALVEGTACWLIARPIVHLQVDSRRLVEEDVAEDGKQHDDDQAHRRGADEAGARHLERPHQHDARLKLHKEREQLADDEELVHEQREQRKHDLHRSEPELERGGEE
mmetsp:Transcript_42278/g.106065  ORF Transcript_42278/g.106065 Transcript_42278/m.106065 type:complete len:367 (-) Transcript_42278:10-1110(-)